MGPKQGRFQKQLAEDLSANLASTMNSNALLTPDAAMRKVTMEMLKNNPWVPPKGCPVNDLPPELLAHIFNVGAQMEADEDFDDEEDEDDYEDELDLMDEWEQEADMDDPLWEDNPRREYLDRKAAEKAAEDEDEDEEDETELPFQVLASHVCHHWREIAIESPSLWTTLTFSEGAPFEKSKTWIQRSKGLPLDIHIDCSIHDEGDIALHDADSDTDVDAVAPMTASPALVVSHGQEYAELHKDCIHPHPIFTIPDFHAILNIIVPYVSQWRLLEVTTDQYHYMHTLLARLSKCPAAPLLEFLELYHSDDQLEDYDTFSPAELDTPFLIFNGNAPKLTNVALWGVHLDWERSIPLFSSIRELEFAYHAENVRPSYATFTKMIATSANVRTLTLCVAGPAEHSDDNDWGTEPLDIPSLEDLVLTYHDAAYVTAFIRKLCAPNVHSLALDFAEEDYTEFVQYLTAPMPGKSKSLLAGLENMKISGLPCDNKSVDLVFEQLAGLRTLNLNCSGEEEEKFFNRLMKASSTGTKLYCPNLHTIITTGIEGARVKAFVEARRAAGVPIKKVLMSEEDAIDEKEENWLRAHVDELEFFEPSDSEEEYIDDPEEDDDMSVD